MSGRVRMTPMMVSTNPNAATNWQPPTGANRARSGGRLEQIEAEHGMGDDGAEAAADDSELGHTEPSLAMAARGGIAITRLTTGLKCAPEIWREHRDQHHQNRTRGRRVAKKGAAVSLVNLEAMMPEPTTVHTSNPVPSAPLISRVPKRWHHVLVIRLPRHHDQYAVLLANAPY